MKKETPIIFSTKMVQAILAGWKTQTRRIMKPQPDSESQPYIVPRAIQNEIDWGKWLWETAANLNHDFNEVAPYWVYKADLAHPDQHGPVTWKPSIHMPKEAARIWDEVTGIRVERIADISEEDCIAEGIIESEWTFTDGSKHKCYKDYSQIVDDPKDYFSTPRNSYRSLWQFLNGKPKLKGGRYEVYPFDEAAAQEFAGMTTWKRKPLIVITNPEVWVIESKQLSVTGKPEESEL